jgi:predicted nucleotidyltransferase
MTPALQPLLEETIEALKNSLGPNLYSCCLYGSAVRGNFVENVSDINLLIVLKESHAAAHEALATVMDKRRQIDPFVLGLPGFERSVRAFAAKFSSIQRHYRVLYGADPLANVKVPADLERFLCEQALRNLRLRLVYSFVTRHRHKAYHQFLARTVTPVFVRLGEVLRLCDHDVPQDFGERIGLFEKEFAIDGAVLRDLLRLKTGGMKVDAADLPRWHERLFTVLDKVIRWIELHWANSSP